MKNTTIAIVITAIVLVAAATLAPWGRVKRLLSGSDATSVPTATAQHSPGTPPERWVRVATPRGRSGAMLRLQVIRPGIILPAEAETYPAAPADLRVVITRQGNDPAEIDVQQGQRSWRVKENQLDRLPPEIRQHVQRPLGWVLQGPAARSAVSTLLPTSEASVSTSGAESRLERRLDELNARLDALFRSIEAVREAP